jgi:tRNA(Ile)-lysidine synthase
MIQAASITIITGRKYSARRYRRIKGLLERNGKTVASVWRNTLDTLVNAFASNPDGRTIATGGCSICLWDVLSGKLLGIKKLIWTPLHDRLHRTLRKRQLLLKNSQILIAVSGGQDSLCLAKLLLDLRSKWHWQLGIVHCDHRWREDSADNATHVEQLAFSWELPYYQKTATTIVKNEAAARQWRYETFSQLALELGYSIIVTGHTQSDRAETLLYNLIRGAGADGLQSLTWKRSLVEGVNVVRPLLEIDRHQTGQFCQEQQLPIWEDSTNQDLNYSRNRIRQELIPYLQTHFHPSVEANIAKTAELLRADVDYLERQAQKLLEQSIENNRSITTLPLHLDRHLLRQAPLALQRRALRQILAAILPSAPTFEQIEKLVDLIPAPNKSCTDPFPGGTIATVEGNWIVLTPLDHPQP